MRVWGLTQFDRVVYIDADALVMDDLDEVKRMLFSQPSGIVDSSGHAAGKANPVKVLA